MKSKFLAGTATAALSFALLSHPGSAATLDEVLVRLEKLEKENAELRQQIRNVGGTKGGAPTAAGTIKGNPVAHAAVATSPAPTPPAGGVKIGGMPVKAGPMAPIIDNTTVTIYGHVDVSGDVFNPSVYDQGTKFGIASNGSYFGIRARHNLTPYGYDGLAVLAQFESQVDAEVLAAAPEVKLAAE